MRITSTRILLFLLLAAAFIFLAWYFSTIITYILVAGVISLVANPLCRYIDNFKIYKGKSLSSGASALVTLLLIAGLFAGIIALVVPPLLNDVQTLATLDQERVMKNFEGPLNQLQSIYEQTGVGEEKSVKEFAANKLKEWVGGKQLTETATSFFFSMGDFLAAVFSIAFIAFFFLKDEKLFQKLLLMLFPPKYRETAAQMFDESKKQLINYLGGLLIQFASLTVIATIGMWILGVNNPIFMGFLFGVLNLVPYVGPLIAYAFGILIAFSTNIYSDFYSGILPEMLKILGVYGFCQFLDNWVLYNYIFSKSVQAHPIELFIVILASATIGGVVGMMIAVPVYCVLRIVAKEFIKRFGKAKIEVA